MKKSVRVLCLLLAALLLITTLMGTFSMFAYAANSSSQSSSSSSSSGSDDTPNYEGSLILLEKPRFQLANDEGDLIHDEDEYDNKVQKNKLYRVIVNVLDRKTHYADVASSNYNIPSEFDYIQDLFHLNSNQNGPNAKLADSNAFVVSNGGNFSTFTNKSDHLLDPTIIAYDRGGATGLVLIFYVVPDGRGRMMDLDVWYSTQQTTDSGKPYYERQSGDIRLKIGQALLDPDVNDTESEDYLTATPQIMVNSYNYGGRDIMAGSQFSLSVKFSNTSKEINLENIIMDVSTSDALYINSGSSSTYVERLEKGGQYEKTIEMSVMRSLTEAKAQQVTLKFSYEYVQGKTRQTATRTEILAIPITMLDRFSVGQLNVPEQIWIGDNTSVSIDYVNKGKSEIANLAGILQSDVPGIGETQTIGNVKAGDSGSIDFTLAAQQPGPLAGKVIITYEDARGEEKRVEREFHATVMDMGGMGDDIPTDMLPEPPQQTGLSKSAKLMAGAGGLLTAGLTCTVVVQKVKSKREEEADEDL